MELEIRIRNSGGNYRMLISRRFRKSRRFFSGDGVVLLHSWVLVAGRSTGYSNFLKKSVASVQSASSAILSFFSRGGRMRCVKVAENVVIKQVTQSFAASASSPRSLREITRQDFTMIISRRFRKSRRFFFGG